VAGRTREHEIEWFETSSRFLLPQAITNRHRWVMALPSPTRVACLLRCSLLSMHRHLCQPGRIVSDHAIILVCPHIRQQPMGIVRCPPLSSWSILDWSSEKRCGAFSCPVGGLRGFGKVFRMRFRVWSRAVLCPVLLKFSRISKIDRQSSLGYIVPVK